METAENFAFVFLVNAVWQVTLVAAIAWLFDRALGHAPAMFRNLLWSVALLVAAVLPFAGLFERDAARTSADSALALTFTPSAIGAASEDPWTPWAWLGSRVPQEGLAAQVGGGISRLLVVLILAAVAWRAFRLIQAWRRTAVIRNSAIRDDGPERPAFARCRNAMATHDADVLFSELVSAPATLGIVYPAVILPSTMRSADFEEDLVASVAHEMAHIRRRDYAWNMLAELLTLPICWHPAAAYLKRMARATCEMACDELATRSLIRPADYARSLVRIAERLTPDRRIGNTLGILDADILEVRVMRLFDRSPRSSSTFAGVTVILAAFVLGVSSVGAAVFSYRVQDATAAPIDEYIVGKWIVTATQDGDDPAKRNAQADDMMRPELTLGIENGVLVGSVVFPKVEVTGDTPSVTGRDPVPVKDPVYRDGTFRFKVNNGEEYLIGELKRTENGLEGRWISSISKRSGTLTMTRAR